MIKITVKRPMWHAIGSPNGPWSVYKDGAEKPIAEGLSQAAAESLIELFRNQSATQSTKEVK